MQLWIGRLVPTLFAAMLTALAIAGTPLVDYRAAASCPAREVFELELSRRLSTTGNFTGSLSIVIEQVDGSYLGRATWKNQVGPSAERFVHHEHCEKLVGALALIGALLLEQEPAPHETTKPVSPEELTAAPTPAAPSKAIAAPKAPAAWVTVVPREFKVTRPSPPAPHKQRTLANWFWGPSVGLTGDGLFAPTFRVGPRLGEVLTLRSTPRSSEFEIKVTAARLTSGTFDTAQGSASITWSSLRLDACYGREAYRRAYLRSLHFVRHRNTHRHQRSGTRSNRAKNVPTSTELACSLQRRNARRRRVEQREQPDSDLLDRSCSEGNAPDEIFERRRSRQQLDEVLETLPFALREVFMLYEFERLSLAEVAELVDIKIGTVSSRLRRARVLFQKAMARLRQRLQSQGEFP